MKVKFAGIALSITFLMLVACKSAENIPPVHTEVPLPEAEKTSIINTRYANDGKIYSCVVFDEILFVLAIETDTNERHELPLEMCRYNPETTELTISRELMLPNCEMTFCIMGIPSAPARFTLNGIKGEPLVMLGRKAAAKDTDYKFSAASRQIEFIRPLDIDSDSYMICCANADGSIQKFGNIPEEFAEFYNNEIKKFFTPK